MIRTLLISLVLAGWLVCQYAAIPHAHCHGDPAERFRPHVHLHLHGECCHASAAEEGDGPLVHSPCEHDGDACYFAAEMTATPALAGHARPVDASLSACIAELPDHAPAAGRFPAPHPPDRWPDAKPRFLVLRTLRI